MYDKEDLKRFISDTLDRAYDNPKLWRKEGVLELIFYRVDLVEEWKK